MSLSDAGQTAVPVGRNGADSGLYLRRFFRRSDTLTVKDCGRMVRKMGLQR